MRPRERLRSRVCRRNVIREHGCYNNSNRNNNNNNHNNNNNNNNKILTRAIE